MLATGAGINFTLSAFSSSVLTSSKAIIAAKSTPHEQEGATEPHRLNQLPLPKSFLLHPNYRQE